MLTHEINFDGLVGPTHNFAGLSIGNVASLSHAGLTSNPRAAALQGLQKAKVLADRGFPQAILPPHERPSIPALRNWGFGGSSDEAVLAAASAAPELLAAASSASAMWTANACIMTPSVDTRDGRAHFTPANLSSNLHRSIEAPATRAILRAIFADEERFVVHEPLGGGQAMADEGAANHIRFCKDFSKKGLHLFVYGRSSMDKSTTAPRRFPARQTLESCQAIARRHGIPDNQSIFLQQSPAAIDAGVFHNDVISTGHRDVFLYHEDAFANPQESIQQLREAFVALSGTPLRLIEIRREQLSLKEAVKTYLFNSQLLDLPDGRLLLVVPEECKRSRKTAALLDQFLQDPANPIGEVMSFDLHESMRNGGGPACLRQRIVLNATEMRHLRGRVLLDQSLYDDLTTWITRNYRDHLVPSELADPRLLAESREALAELARLLHLPY
jgi:succinylarginine dihydrolase